MLRRKALCINNHRREGEALSAWVMGNQAALLKIPHALAVGFCESLAAEQKSLNPQRERTVLLTPGRHQSGQGQVAMGTESSVEDHGLALAWQDID